MGDVGTHGEVTLYVRDQLRKQFPGGVIADEDYTYLELGNFLTDVSQFRDPPAHHKARDEVWSQAVGSGVIPIIGPLIVLIGGVGGWVEEVFGEDEAGREHGKLAAFFGHVVLAMTHLIFADDGMVTWRSRANGLGLDQSLPAALQDLHPLPPEEVDRVFARAFTQYWPHEHLDLPPVRNLRTHREKRIFRPARSKLLRYLEWDIQFLSEEFSTLEIDWVRARRTNASPREKRDLLVRLGNLLHPIEDYFFHSNFVELRQWQHAASRNRDIDPESAEGRRALARRSLVSTRLRQDSIRLRRVLYRRLRYPEYERGDKLSEEESDEATGFLFTGGFGKTDIFHTLGAALEAMEAGARRTGLHILLSQHRLILVRLLFDRAARQRMVEEELEEDHADLHKQQLMEDQVHRSIRDFRQQGMLSDRAEQELLRAFDVDKQVEDEWSLFPGIGGLLIQILAELEKERSNSARRRRRLDGRDSSIAHPGSDNEASEEHVGTHSLLSKDSENKEPLRADAVALAKHASASIALLLLKRVSSNQNVRQGLDWDTLLRYYLRFPRARRTGWYNELLMRLRRSGTAFTQPEVADLRDQPNHGLLGPNLQPEKLRARRQGGTRAQLEQYYSAFEQ